MTRILRLPLLLALAAASGSSAAQQPAEPPILSVRTDLVTLSVTVVDREGALVAGLRPEQFTVYDGGEAQPIQFFSSEDLAATIGLIVDSSGSMRGRREEVAAAAAAFVAMRHPLDEFFALNFNEAVWTGLPAPLAFTADADQLRAAVLASPPRGMTALYDALDRGLAYLGRGTRDRKALIVVSDGGDNASVQTLTAVLERARQTSAVIYSVTLADPDNRDARPQVLKALARETGGRVLAPARAEDVLHAFAAIAEEIRSGYTIGFAPAESADGGFRPVRVVVDAGNHRQLIARTRAGYHAGPPRVD